MLVLVVEIWWQFMVVVSLFMLQCSYHYSTYVAGFAADQFNDKNPNLGNKVIFYNEFKNFSCDVVTYDSSTEKIVCRTQYEEKIKLEFIIIIITDLILMLLISNYKYSLMQYLLRE